MSRPTALVTAPFRGEGLTTLEGVAEVVYDPWIEHTPLQLLDGEALAARIAAVGADIVVCEADSCTGPVLDAGLRVIGSTRGDPTNVDVSGATERGIPVLHAPGRNADGVAELAVGLLLAATRGIVPADKDVRAGTVYSGGTIPYQRYRAWQIAGQTAGIIGLGSVGRAAVWRFEGLGMRVISYDPFNDAATHDLGDLLAEADVVSMHAMVTPDSIGLMGADQFARMKVGSVYLNTARAALHDIDALTDALASGHLGAAGLDHFEGENLPVDHPLQAMTNVVLTPHIGGATYDTEANHSKLVADDIARLLIGERPVHCANPEVFT